jgi:hypothetical protein
VDKYQQLDQDLQLIERFDNFLHDPDVPLGTKLKRYLEEFRPAVDRVVAFLTGWNADAPAQAAGAPLAALEDDDVPF